MTERRNIRVAYIHGRPEGHPIHTKIAKTINSDFFPVDFKIRWHDIPSSRFRRYLSWLVCAFTFPDKRKYDVFFTEDAYFFPGIMRVFKLIARKQKIVALMASHTLFFLYTNHYSKITSIALKKLLKNYDAIICIGITQYLLVQKILGEDHNVKVYKIFNGVPKERFKKLIKVSPSLGSNDVVFIGNIENRNRAKYKGIDLMLQGFALAKQMVPKINFKIVGNCDLALINEMVEIYAPSFKDSIKVIGSQKDITQALASSAMYLHCARGDAFPTTVMEALTAGLPPLVSEWTGNKELALEVHSQLVVPLESQLIADRIIWYFQLKIEDKYNLSDRCKKVIQDYTEEKALHNFKNIFDNMYNELSTT